MAKVSVSRDIAAPQEKVWATLANPQRFEEWLTLHTKWKEEPPAEISAGSQVTEVLTIMGMANTIVFSVESYDPPNSLRMSGTGMAGAKITMALAVTPAGEGSTVTLEAEFESQMMVGAIGSAIERASTKELQASLDKFTTLVG